MATGTWRRPDLQRAARAGQDASRSGVEWAARVGYAARGAVYAVIGVLALMLAAGEGGQATDTHGAVEEVARQPFGSVLLVLLGVGLVAFALWRFAQAAWDLEDKGRSGKGLAARVGMAGSGVIHASLALTAFNLLRGQGGGGGGGNQGLTARLMSQPFGQVLVVLVGLGVMGFAGYQLHRAWKGRMLEKLSLSGLAARRRTEVERICKAGVAARGVVFLLVGSFFIQAALSADPGEAGGLGEALGTLARQPFGPWLLGLVALGLVAYAVYQLCAARYRRIPTP
ncbi:DUF1206 domain-containing protein [Myxococcus sp. AM009]|uniref:DUF1206 domain-containing protein n=2 Tax=Myxococcus TaxID=32 RepID=UPI0015960B5D|nr:DUF1206 domain-containing protein [Myxococcus sp. AM009]NVJ00062.1 DUF1206 domain-containing protein [Myxococcus sp. AM009]